MSVQTQIDRISGAVDAALAALTEKGVTVPAGTKVDGLAALIAAIEAGGGSGGAAHGTFILDAYSNLFTPGVPFPDDNFFIAILPNANATSLGTSYVYHGWYHKKNGVVSSRIQGTNASSSNGKAWVIDKEAGTAKFNGYYFKEGYEYRWYMGALA